MVERKCRVSDRVIDDAVHRLALMCAESGLKGTTLDPCEVPIVAADLYCNASEMIRSRINLQRLTDGTHPDTFSGTDMSKAWFDVDVTEVVLHRGEKTRYA